MSTEKYTDNEIRDCFVNHLMKIDDTELSIHRLGLYALFNHTKYQLFIEAIKICFEKNVKNIATQLAYIHLVNEIVQRETQENAQLFLPLIEIMMIKAGGTKDENHIKKCKRVLSILESRRIVDAKFVERVNALIDFNAKSADDEDSIIVDRFYALNTQLIQAKNKTRSLITEKKSETELEAALQRERQIRTDLTDFYSKQINAQYAQIERIDKQLDQKKKSEIDDLIGKTDSSDSSDEL